MLASILRNFEHIPTTDTMAFRRIASTKKSAGIALLRCNIAGAASLAPRNAWLCRRGSADKRWREPGEPDIARSI